MGAFPSLPLFTDAYIADTAHLTCEEHGAYLRLLIFAWRSPGCRLPDDDARMARMLGLAAKRWAAIKPAVMAFWTLEDGHWLQKRLSREHQFVSEKVEKRRASGKLGGRPKPLENNETIKANGSEKGKQNQSEQKAPNPTPTFTPVVPKGTLVAEFAEWWSLYPRRKGTNSRAAAEDLYVRIRQSGVERDVLFAAVRAYAAEIRRDGKLNTDLVKQAESFLSIRKRLWEDYAAKEAPRQPIGLFDAANATAQHPYAGWSDDRWREEVRMWRGRCGDWPWKKSAPPDDPRTAVPRHILAEMNIHPARARAA